MKADWPIDHRRRRSFTILGSALAVVLSSMTAQGEMLNPIALNQPEKIFGQWKSFGGFKGATPASLELGFSGKGGFEMRITPPSGKTIRGQGTCKIDASRWPMQVAARAFDRDLALEVMVLPNDLLVVWVLDSPAEARLEASKATLLIRAAQSPADVSQAAAGGSIIGRWKSTGDSIALEGGSMAMSFSENGEVEIRMSEGKGQEEFHRGTYTLDRTGSPWRMTVESAGKKAHYALELESADQMKIEGLKSPQDDAEMGEESVTMVRDQTSTAPRPE